MARSLPDGGLWIEEDFAGERREAGLDIAGSGRVVAGEKVAEVALRLDEVTTLGDADESRADGGVAMWMETHAGADDVGDLVKAAVVLVPERMENAALDGF